MPATGPLRSFGHSHAHLGELSLELTELLQGDALANQPAAREELPALAAELKDELLEHFANEEEGLFPFVRDHVLELCDAVDHLQSAHDFICGALVRFSFLAEREGPLSPEARLAFERFQAAYSEHSRDEADLLDALTRILTPAKQAELETLLRALG
jgi:iron-sulfur cluster repair protein YtfE (RIC family)